jgi:RNA polymerase sigma factor (sigma-70 family)
MPAQMDPREAFGERWDALDRQYRAPLLAYFRKRVSDTADAEDLTQEVFTRLARHADKDIGEGLNAYIFTIAQNIRRDWLRDRVRHKRGSHFSLGDLQEGGETPAILVEERTPERVLVSREALKDIEEALGELHERTQAVFILSRLENMHRRDIAALHGISVSAVEKHVMKAMAHLTRRLKRR